MICPLNDILCHDCPDTKDCSKKTINIILKNIDDPVNHPKHYTSHPSGIECIEITRHMNFNLGNVVKYIWREGIKDEEVDIQDLEKAAWYLQDEISKRKAGKAE